jgi:hypothetical protein
MRLKNDSSRVVNGNGGQIFLGKKAGFGENS